MQFAGLATQRNLNGIGFWLPQTRTRPCRHTGSSLVLLLGCTASGERQALASRVFGKVHRATYDNVSVVVGIADADLHCATWSAMNAQDRRRGEYGHGTKNGERYVERRTIDVAFQADLRFR